ncbi:hypothetical protein KUTeg_008996, partial [Tegillarca granosa]
MGISFENFIKFKMVMRLMVPRWFFIGADRKATVVRRSNFRGTKKSRGRQEVQVELSLTVMKSLGAKWIVKAYNYIRGKNDITVNGFMESGILDVVEK